MPVSPAHQVRMYMRWRPQFFSGGSNTWKHIGEIVTFPAIVDNDTIIEFQAATRRYPLIAKGVRQTINAAFELGFDSLNHGQELLRTARDRDEDFQFKIELRDFLVYTDAGAIIRRRWTTLLFRAMVSGFGVTPGSSGQFVTATASLAIPNHTFSFTTQSNLASSAAPTIAESEAEDDTPALLEEPYTSDQPPEETS